MKRTNTPSDALNRNKAVIDVGDGLPPVELPLDGNFGGTKGDPGEGVPTGGAPLQVVRKNVAGTTTEWATPSKSMVGLSNVDNTADVDKPISTATQSALDGKASATSLTNGLNGKADLSGGKVPISQIPTDALVTDANVAAVVDGAQTGPAIDARINTQVTPVVEQITADYIASDQTIVDAAAAAVDANPKISTLENNQWVKASVGTTTDANIYVTPGLYELTGSTVSNRPVTGQSGSLEVTVTGSVVNQRWTTPEENPRTFYRSRIGGVWSNWVAPQWNAPVSLRAGDDFDTLQSPGTFVVQAGSVLNKPTSGLGFLEVIRFNATSIMQRFVPFNAAADVFVRSMTSTGWKEWKSSAWWSGSLVNGVDLDTLTTPSVHNITFITHPNQPTARVGVLTVAQGGTLTVQKFEPTTGNADLYRRTKNSTGWSEWDKATTSSGGNEDGGTTTNGVVRGAIGAWEATSTSRPAIEIVRAYNQTRTIGLNGSHSFGWLMETRDDGATWTNLHQFDTALGWAKFLDNGEIIASVGKDPDPREIWVSSGYGTSTVTWSKSLTADTAYAYFAEAWSVSIHKNMVFLNEYGPKEPLYLGNAVTQGARYTYMSLDYGKTFTTIFDLKNYIEVDRGLVGQQGMHLHGVAWDEYWDRIWVTFGDDTNGTVFSDDLGATWQTADWGSSASAPGQHQAVGIAPLPGCILFGSDGAPNGVWRIDREAGKHSGSYVIEDAWTIPADRLTHLCQAILRVPQAGGTDVWLFGFGTETRAGYTQIVATRDGFKFTKIWEDPDEVPVGRGVRSIAGPNLKGELIVGSHDGRVPNMWSEWRGKVRIY